MRITEGVPPRLVEQTIMKFCVDHLQWYRLAFVYARFGEHDLLPVRTDAEGKHRWVFERTYAWFSGFGKLRIRKTDRYPSSLVRVGRSNYLLSVH